MADSLRFYELAGRELVDIAHIDGEGLGNMSFAGGVAKELVPKK